ncbi:hypothetical protein MTO96_043161, partial [Rhipicephalus appendiculatus]
MPVVHVSIGHPNQIRDWTLYFDNFSQLPSRSRSEASGIDRIPYVKSFHGDVREEEQLRCISEGVDPISRSKPTRVQIPLRRVEAFLSDHSLTLVPADKEGGFAVLSLDLFRKKGHEA